MLHTHHILVCGGTGCHSCKSDIIYDTLRAELEKVGIADDVSAIQTGCFGFCEQGPIVKIMPDQSFYVHVTPDDVPEIVEQHILKGLPVTRLLYKDPVAADEPSGEDAQATTNGEISFYSKQQRNVLRNCGVINPEDITDYIARDGYVALEKVLFEMTPDEVLKELKASGLRGRGGAGFPTWMKWKFTKDAVSDEKWIVCNGDEGDPGAYMDRSVLEGDPHSVIEALLICGRTVGAQHGVVYVRAEYGLAIKRLQIALQQAYERGLLGENILGSGFNFDIDIRLGAGAFVCGEETALLESIEGKRGTPRPRPPYPAVAGLFGKPTVINNVETLANIPLILANGGAWFSGIGTNDSKGTKVFALTGKVKISGLIEVPMGTTLREIIHDIGGGTASGKNVKAVQTGGPSGGIIPAEYLDTPVDYENLIQLGSMMGSGGMIVMDESDCVVDIARFYLGFCVEESCGKCSACRIGGYQMLRILDKISEGQGQLCDLDKLQRIALAMKKGSLCGLGQTAANPVLSTLRYFPDEYREHIVDKKCRALKCRALFGYEIDQAACKRCSLCVRSCPVEAITGDRKTGYTIDTAKCIKCGHCFEVCRFKAITGLSQATDGTATVA